MVASEQVNAARLDAVGNGAWTLAGALTFDTVAELWRRGLDDSSGAAAVTLDLAGVERTDSAGLALIVGWMRAARRRGMELRLRNIPAQMLAIAATTRLDALLQRG